MEVEIVSRESIKPSKPTSDQNRTYRLSVFDQSVAQNYVPILLFYNNGSSDHNVNHLTIVNRLKSSLSEALSHYFPLAGKVQHDHDHDHSHGPIIDCNDEGALFVEARAKYELAGFLGRPPRRPDLSLLDALFPNGLQWKVTPNKDAITLAVQVTEFEDGYYSVGACFSHKFADAYTMGRFLNDWASLARSGQAHAVDPPPLFNGPSVFPPPEGDVPLPGMQLYFMDNAVTRRFLFSGARVSELKAAITNTTTTTRFQAVTSLLYECFVRATHEKYYRALPPYSPAKTYLFLQLVNMRGKLTTVLPIDDSMGNFVGCPVLPLPIVDGARIDGGDVDEGAGLLGSIAVKLRDKLRDFTEELGKNIGNYDNKNEDEAREYWVSIMRQFDDALKSNAKIDQVFLCSSWCRFPFYEVDFGWGEPVWVSLARNEPINTVYMVDTKDGKGIEAWVTLDKHVMEAFEVDERLSKFATLNPSILGEDAPDII